MKPLLFSLSIFSIIIWISCAPDADEPQLDPQGEYSFYITGINQSLNYTFSPSNGRQAASAPRDVKNLTVLIADEDGSIVYEQYYYNYNDYYDWEDSLKATHDGVSDYYYYENTIPDTLFIPKLNAGNYTIMAATSNINYYHYYDQYYPEGGVDTFHMEIEHPRIDSYTTSEGPVYVGQSSIVLSEEAQEVDVSMENISAKITLERQGGTDGQEEGWLEVNFYTKDNAYYSFEDEGIHPNEYDYDENVYGYLDWRAKRSFYVLPKTITNIRISYYDYRTGAAIYQDVEIDPDIILEVGDAITFSVDTQGLLEGSGSSVFEWEEINWNDLGDIDIP